MKHIILISTSFLMLLSGAINAQFDTLFVRNYGGSANEAPGFGSGFAGAPVVRAVSDNTGAIYTLSFTESTDGDILQNAGLEDIILVKTSAEGQTEWVKTFGGSAYERAYSIRLLNNGNLLIAGKTASNNGTFSNSLGSEDAFLMEVNQQGDLIWTRNYGGSQIDTFFDVIELSSGGYIACGSSGSIDGDINDASYAGSNKAWIIRLNQTGEPVWSRITNGIVINNDWEESFWHVRLNNQNDAVYLLGASYNFNDINSDDLLLCRYTLDGTQNLKEVFGGNGGDSPAGLEIAENGDVLLLGTIRGGSGDVSNYSGGNADAWLLRTNAAGEIIWDRNYGGTDLDYAYGMNVNSAGMLTLSLSTRSINETAQSASFGLLDGLILQVNPETGDTLFTRRWGSSASDYAHEVVWADDLSWFVSVGRSAGSDGYFSGSNGGTDLVLLKYTDLTAFNHTIKQSQNVLVYPNPANEFIFIDSPINGAYAIYDLSGREVFSGSLEQKLLKISLEKGIYTCIILSEDPASEIKYTKIIVQ